MPSFLFWNSQSNFFYDLAPWNGSLSQPHVSRGLAVADYNNDGAMDVAIVDQGEGVWLRRAVSGSSYLSQDSHRVHIGLGAATKIDRLEVR
jgi:hypothetical protein